MKHMKLIGAVTSPYVRKVRIVMAEKKLDYQFVTEDVWAADTSITQSNPVGKLIPPTGRERAEVKTWEALADGVLDAAILARLEATWGGRKDSERSTAWIDRQLKKIHDSLAAMERALQDRQYCTSNHMSLADIAVGCALGYLDFRFAHIDWRSDHANLAQLYERLAQRQSFKDSAPV
jgi:glutathione S-transferase